MAARVTQRQVEALVSEIQRYLEAVETFRTQGHEPHWREEFRSPDACAANHEPPAS
jgi:hypothetical protein